jgi:hypothetical protein
MAAAFFLADAIEGGRSRNLDELRLVPVEGK